MSSWNSQFVDSTQLTTISELTPLTVYTIKVQGFTSVGPGPLSPPVQIKTQQGGKNDRRSYSQSVSNILDEIVDVSVPSQPRDLRATEIGESKITLEWNKPSHSGESITGYDLMWNDTYSKVEYARLIRPIFANALLISIIQCRKKAIAGFRRSSDTRWRNCTRIRCITCGCRRDRKEATAPQRRPYPSVRNNTVSVRGQRDRSVQYFR